MRAKKLLIAAAASILGGCTVGPDYHPPRTSLPAAYDAGPASFPATRPSTGAGAARPVDLARWWQSLDDPELDSLVERGIAANLDLKIALMRLQETRAAEYVVTGGMLPLVDISAGAARGTGSDSTRGRVGAPIHSAANTFKLSEITEVAGFDAAWEIDLFGRFRREIEAAHAESQAAAEARNAVLISVISDVARGYVHERALQLRLAFALANFKTEQQTFNLVQTRFNRGLTNELDVALSQRQLATVRALIAPLQASIPEAQRRVAVLLGLPPQALYAELQGAGALPPAPDAIVPGLPVELLRRRPDVRAAERQLAASNARIGVATANLFPRVALIGAFGGQGQGLGRTRDEGKMIWSFGPGAYWPILDFGTLDALVQVQDLRTRELLYTYRRTILSAVEEVDNAIGNYNAQRDRLYGLADAVAASQRAVQLATERYDRGLTDFLNVLDAQRQLYDLQDQYAVAQESVVLQYIALYKALGGGWERYQAVPAIRHPQPAVVAAGLRVVAPPPSPLTDGGEVDSVMPAKH